MFGRKMVKEYLEKIKQELVEKKFSLVEQITSCKNQLKEIEKFLEILENTNDPNYDAFTPRETNTFNRKKIKELHAEYKTISEQLIILQDQQEEIEFRIAEITSVIRVAREDEDGPFDSGDLYDSRLALLRTVEEERQRIARDLHDSTTQNLTALVHKAELCTKLLDTDPVKCKLELFTISKTLREIIEDMRGLIYDLRPMSFDDIGFDVTVERTLDKFNRFHNIACNYEVINDPYPLDKVVKITLLRVIQEACNNAIKHAQASKLDVTLSYEEARIVLTIKDNGKGFDINSIPKESRNDNSGFGLSMMRERVFLLSGKIDLESSPGNGCTIIVTIPKLKEVL